ncbi:MAG TPA: hypothetical protein PLC80_02545, partial [Draconibacterium sp.]|nr:hypothetical protein [Draconibacterium sp.]
NLFYGGRSESEMIETSEKQEVAKFEKVSEETPQFRNISIRNIEIRGAMQAVLIQGLPEMNLEKIELSDMKIEADKGFSVVDANGIKICKVELSVKSSTTFNFQNSKNVILEEIESNINTSGAVTINGNRCENISLVSSEKTDYKKQTIIGEEVPESALKFN